MKIIEHLNHLDKLILDTTRPPATAKLRNYLSTIIEQAQAEESLPDVLAGKEKEIVDLQAAHSREVAALREENSCLKAKIEQQEDRWRREMRARQQKLWHGHDLNYSV